MNLLRSSIEFLNKTLGHLKAGRRIDAPQEITNVRLNLGCGLAVTKGWINVDGSLNALVASMPSALHPIMYRLAGAKQYYSESEYCRLLRDHSFIHHDLSNGIPFKDCVADYIYTSHFVEHLYLKDAIHLVNECYRVLKNGGTVRICVPDLEYALKLYSSGKKQDMLQNYFFVEDDESYYARHKYMYDYEMLSTILSQSGFHDIQRCKFQEGSVPDMDILDNRPDETLFVEARK